MLECNPCGKTFNGPACYRDHLESSKHKKKITNLAFLNNQKDAILANKNGISGNVHGSIISCKSCGISFNSFESFHEHSLTKEHAENVISKPNVNYNDVTNHSSCIDQKVNDASAERKFVDDDNILDGLNEKKIIPQFLQVSENHMSRTELQENLSLNAVLACEPCKKTFSGEIPYIQHIKSEIHKKKLQNLQYIENQLSEVDSPSKLENNVTANSINPWFCKICNIPCSGHAPYQQHINGAAHLKNVIRKQQSSAVTGISPQPMQTPQNLQNIENHMSDVDSPSKIGDNMKTNNISLWFCDICNIPCSGYAPYQQHISGSTHLKNSNRKLQNISITGISPQPMHQNGNGQQLMDQNAEIILPELIGLNYVSTKELEESVKIFSPTDNIDFDEATNRVDVDSISEKADSSVSVDANDAVNENHVNGKTETNLKENHVNGETETNLKENHVNGETKTNKVDIDSVILKAACSVSVNVNEAMKENQINEETETKLKSCDICNVMFENQLHAMLHYESVEHFKKRWHAT